MTDSNLESIAARCWNLRTEAERRKQSGTLVGYRDCAVFHYIADAIQSDDLPAAIVALARLDTEARDAVLSFIHPTYWASLGFAPLRLAESIAEHAARFSTRNA